MDPKRPRTWARYNDRKPKNRVAFAGAVAARVHGKFQVFSFSNSLSNSHSYELANQSVFLFSFSIINVIHQSTYSGRNGKFQNFIMLILNFIEICNYYKKIK